MCFINNKYDILSGADALLILTEWTEFKTPDFDKIKQMYGENYINKAKNNDNKSSGKI